MSLHGVAQKRLAKASAPACRNVSGSRTTFFLREIGVICTSKLAPRQLYPQALTHGLMLTLLVFTLAREKSPKLMDWVQPRAIRKSKDEGNNAVLLIESITLRAAPQLQVVKRVRK